MHLSDYMTLRGISDDEMAAKIKRSRPTVSRIRRGVVRPDWDTIESIRKATDGEVTANDFIKMKVAS